MVKAKDVQNGTYKQLGKDVGIVAAMQSDLKGGLAYYVSEREKYVSEFNLWSKKTAQASLETGRVVYEAKQHLSKNEFKAFVSDIKAGSTIRKYLAIGEHYEKFYQYADLLPNAWTSIYEITLLPADVFDALVATESSMANMTGAQLRLLRGEGTDDKSKSSSTASAVTPAVKTVPVAPETAQNSSKATENAKDTHSQSDIVEAAAASSDAIQNVASESVTECVDTVSDDTSSESDHEYAQQATSKMLERVNATASTSVDVETNSAMPTYEVIIRFNSIPTDDSWFDLTEEIENLVEKYNFDVEVIVTRPSFVE